MPGTSATSATSAAFTPTAEEIETLVGEIGAGLVSGLLPLAAVVDARLAQLARSLADEVRVGGAQQAWLVRRIAAVQAAAFELDESLHERLTCSRAEVAQ